MAGNWADSTRRSRLPADWDRRRRRVLRRDSYRCWLCGSFEAVEVDHKAAGDDHSLENLAAICIPCHRRKSSAEGNAARQSKRRPRDPHPGDLTHEGTPARRGRKAR